MQLSCPFGVNQRVVHVSASLCFKAKHLFDFSYILALPCCQSFHYYDAK